MAPMTPTSRTAWLALALLLVWAAVSIAADEGESVEQAAELALIEETRRAAEEHEGDIEYVIELGNALYEGNMMDDALDVYLEAAEIDSTHAGVWLNIGSIYSDRGDLHEAVNVLEKALRLDPDNPMIYSNLGSTYYARRQFDDAVEMYRKAILLDAATVEGHFNMGVAFADAQIFDEAIREWELVIESAPESPAAQICRENIEMIREFRGDDQ